ncbi:MAG: nitrilase-related carbon-nitrogen hydrolase [Pseudomonadota bacterium]
MIIAAAAYALDWHDSWITYEKKITEWVEGAAEAEAKLLVFPEYAAVEMASLGGKQVARDREQAMRSISELVPTMDALFKRLAGRNDVLIAAPGGPVYPTDTDRPTNQIRLIGPTGVIGAQDKLILTQKEREEFETQPGEAPQLLETDIGMIGILPGYDADFPMIARRMVEEGAMILLVPSFSDTLAGYWRQRIGAMARALEGQCVVAHAPLVGSVSWAPWLGSGRGAAAIYGPPDLGFSETGVLDEGPMDQPGWAVAEVTVEAIAQVRQEGQALVKEDWAHQDGRLDEVQLVTPAEEDLRARFSRAG